MVLIKRIIPLKILVLKNKQKTYLLLIAVVSIWGTIAYRILSAIEPDEVPISQSIMMTNDHKISAIEMDTTTIKPVERDPFLGTLKRKMKRKITTNTIVKKDSVAPQIQIGYQGLISGEDSQNQIFAVSIDRQQFLMKKGQSIQGVQLVKGDSHQITIKQGRQLRTITIQ